MSDKDVLSFNRLLYMLRTYLLTYFANESSEQSVDKTSSHTLRCAIFTLEANEKGAILLQNSCYSLYEI